MRRVRLWALEARLSLALLRVGIWQGRERFARRRATRAGLAAIRIEDRIRRMG